MKSKLGIIALCALLALSGCNGFLSGPSDSSPEDLQTEWIDVVNSDSESHTVTVVVEHDGEEIANETHVLRVPDSGESALERVTYDASEGESYTVRARMDGGEWYSGEIDSEQIDFEDIQIGISERGEISVYKASR